MAYVAPAGTTALRDPAPAPPPNRVLIQRACFLPEGCADAARVKDLELQRRLDDGDADSGFDS
jgi:hypothetical protein